MSELARKVQYQAFADALEFYGITAVVPRTKFDCFVIWLAGKKEKIEITLEQIIEMDGPEEQMRECWNCFENDYRLTHPVSA